jgi:hypothetical protein
MGGGGERADVLRMLLSQCVLDIRRGHITAFRVIYAT